MNVWMHPVDAHAWVVVAFAWFQDGELAHAAAAYLQTYDVIISHGGGGGSGGNDADRDRPRDIIVDVFHHLAAIAQTWGYLDIARDLYVGAISEPACSASLAAAFRLKAATMLPPIIPTGACGVCVVCVACVVCVCFARTRVYV